MVFRDVFIWEIGYACHRSTSIVVITMNRLDPIEFYGQAHQAYKYVSRATLHL